MYVCMCPDICVYIHSDIYLCVSVCVCMCMCIYTSIFLKAFVIMKLV